MRRRFGKGAALLLIVACASLILVLFGAFRERAKGTDPREVAESFARSLMEGKEGRAKSLTAPLQHERIDSWFAEHGPFQCTPPYLSEEGYSWGASCGSSTEDARTCIVIFECNIPGRVFAVWDVDLSLTDNGWQIVNWEKIEAKEK